MLHTTVQPSSGQHSTIISSLITMDPLVLGTLVERDDGNSTSQQLLDLLSQSFNSSVRDCGCTE